MDLSFTFEPSPRSPHREVFLADILALADLRRVDSDRGMAGKRPERRDEEHDLVHILACRLVPDSAGPVDTELLGGSFNPLIARQLMVGEVGEPGVYLRDLADVQG